MRFWVKRFLTVLAGAFVVIGIAQLVRGHSLAYAATQAGFWGVVSALVFTVSRWFQASRGQHCALCKDTPEMQEKGRDARSLVIPPDDR